MSDTPLSMAEGAVGLHELFTSLMKAGFTEQQALYLISQMIVGQGGNPRIPPAGR